MEEKKQQQLKIVLISDTHEFEGIVIPKADILIHAGDFTNNGKLDKIIKFNEFLGTLKIKHKIVIPGNREIPFDELQFQKFTKEKTYSNDKVKSLLTNCIYLENQLITIEGLRIFGCPWHPARKKSIFGKILSYFNKYKPYAAFAVQDQAVLIKKLNEIPKDLDILITHAPPYEILDLSLSQKHCGGKQLRKVVGQVKPKVHVFGHIHEAFGIMKTKNTLFINASVIRKTSIIKKSPDNVPVCLTYDYNSKEFCQIK